ncbi:GAF and ANTAR domain-containing protein [Lapillicoccus sp.]|uniref:GAF and ANTAR domain-containing protein n=1 Tax=Lapillicoccus sp. TaxID=1909287 RepID=UPI003982FE9B
MDALINAEPAASDERPGTIGRLERLCTALVRALPASGAGVSLINEDHTGGGIAAASAPLSRRLEELEFTHGEGPSVTSFDVRRPVLEPDLAGRGMRRWPGYAPDAYGLGVRAVFAFPLQVGAARLGALEIYRDEPVPLSAPALRQAFTFAEVALALLLDGQNGATAAGLDDVLAYRAEVYQAQGMVMIDLGVSLTEAMARLRGHAYAENRYLSDVARDVVAGKLALDVDSV